MSQASHTLDDESSRFFRGFILVVTYTQKVRLPEKEGATTSIFLFVLFMTYILQAYSYLINVHTKNFPDAIIQYVYVGCGAPTVRDNCEIVRTNIHQIIVGA